ncbi:hypothetical protein VO64_3889 [Pseudomonas synxantha]|uniref:Uncharacterized protein n=1 Tax=Pseudomonas synxantha TaxID=47883 RepID=A0AAU8TPV8_9PSED|nr:hypothetical protein VO64_3889 [Pseudomonas synxantha]
MQQHEAIPAIREVPIVLILIYPVKLGDERDCKNRKKKV